MILSMTNLKAPSASLFNPKSMAQMKGNPFNAAVQVHENDAYWAGELEYSNLDFLQTRVMRTFINKLNGPVGDFWFRDFTHSQLGTWSGNITVDGSGQDGRMLLVTGAVPNALIAPAGDRFQLGDFTYELLEDALANSAGNCILRFLPDLRRIPTNGQSLVTGNPLCKCMLSPDQLPPRLTRKSALTDYKFKFRESYR